ncbi:hypothetical protein PLESTF_001940400 [Pleodorina starrii]|nr:hypothetical protein PLESTM_001925400 [Pleodorina starrii]GLC77481.1 hypothetical protein PLESTF_001940400 [Pleodorina starrii]
MQPPLRLAQAASPAGAVSGRPSADTSSPGCSSSGSGQAGVGMRGAPGSRRLVWRAGPAQPPPSPPPAPRSLLPRERERELAATRTWVGAGGGGRGGGSGAGGRPYLGGGEVARVVSLGSLGPLLLRPFPTGTSGSSTVRRRERGGGSGGGAEEVDTAMRPPLPRDWTRLEDMAPEPDPAATVGSAARGRSREGGGAPMGGSPSALGPLSRPPRSEEGRNSNSSGSSSNTGLAFSGGGTAGCWGDLFRLFPRCSTCRELRQLHRDYSGRLLPDHIPALMAAAAKLCTRNQNRNRARSDGDGGERTHQQQQQQQQGEDRHGQWRQQQGEESKGEPDVDVDVGAAADDADESHQLVVYVWELAGSALRLARSRELPPRSLATAMWAVAKLPLSHHQQQQDTLPPGELVGRSPSTHPRDAPAPAPAPCREEWLQWVREMARCAASSPALLAGFSPQDVSQTLWAVASLECGPLPRAFLEGLLEAARPRLAAFSPQSLSNSLWALSRLRCQPPPAWLEAACAASAPQLAAFSPQALATTAAALAHLEYCPGADWWAAFFEACHHRMWPHTGRGPGVADPHMDPRQPPGMAAMPGPTATTTTTTMTQPLSTQAAAAAALDAAAAETAVAATAAPASCARMDMSSGAAAAISPAVAGPGGWGRLASSSPTQPQPQRQPASVAPPPPPPQSLAQTAWAVARLGVAPPAPWLEGLVAAAAAAGPRLNGQDVANLMWALGALGYRDLGRCSSPDTVDMDWGNTRTGPAPAPLSDAPAPRSGPRLLLPLLGAWQRCLERDTLQPQQLSACLVACVHLGLEAGAGADGGGQSGLAACRSRSGSWSWSDAVERSLESLGRRLPACSGQVVANALWAAARLGCRPPSAWVGAAVERFMRAMEDDDAGPQEVANVWWSLGRLRWVPPPDTASDLLARSLALVASGDLTSGELASMMWALGRLGIRLPKPLMDRLVAIVRSALIREGRQARQEQQQQQRGGGPAGAPAATSTSTAGRPRPRGHLLMRAAPAAPPATLVTLLRALSARQATSQRSTAMSLLERSLRHMTMTLTPPPALAVGAFGAAGGETGAEREGPRLRRDVQPAAAAGPAAARQVSLSLHSAASLGVALCAESGRPGAGSSRGLAGAVVAAVRAVLPYTNSRDLAMCLSALAAMEAAVPMGLLAAALQRAGELHGVGGPPPVGGPAGPAGGGGGGSAALRPGGLGPQAVSVADLATSVCSLGRLLELHAECRGRGGAERASRAERGAGGGRGSGSGGSPEVPAVPDDDDDGRNVIIDADGDGDAGEVGVSTGGGGGGAEQQWAARAAAAAAAAEVRSRWDELLLSRPRLAGAREVLLAAALAHLEGQGQGQGQGDSAPAGGAGASTPPPSLAHSAVPSLALTPEDEHRQHSPAPASTAAAAADGAGSGSSAGSGVVLPPLSPASVQHLILGCSLARLRPGPRLLRLLAGRLVGVSGELPGGVVAACLAHLAAMGAEMEPGLAERLVAGMRERLRAQGPARAQGRGWVAAVCGGVSLLVAMWVLRRRGGGGGGVAEVALRTASPGNRAGRCRLRRAAEVVDPVVMRRLQGRLTRLREEAECLRTT